MYLMIENPGEADLRAFTKLGVSTARGDCDKIGQFGSGAKLGILLFLRKSLNPTIYCGRSKVEFYTQPNIMGETEYNDVYVRFDNQRPKELDYAAEFGALDWTDVNMAFRELVSNAIDNSDSVKDVRVEVAQTMRAKSGYTRVFVPWSQESQEFLNTINERFLHFARNREMQHGTMLDKKAPGKAKIYRKGVFVREMSRYSADSLWDYNFGDELEIDECRNASNGACECSIAQAIANSPSIVTNMFERFISDENRRCPMYEDMLSAWDLTGKDFWADLWDKVAGTGAVIITEKSTLVKQLTAKGFHPVRVPSGWYEAMKNAGIMEGCKCLSHVENNGAEILQPTQNAIDTLNKVWGWLSDFNMVANKQKPPVRCFSQVMDAGTVLCGYYEPKDGHIYINVDNDTDSQTMLEELAHYVTGSTDNSRDFQDYAFKAATRIAEFLYS